MAVELPRYVVFGEALTDMLRQDDGRWLAVPGGACWNVARVGARLGIATALAGAVSKDLFGDQLASEGAAAGLDDRFLQRVDAAPLLAMVPSQHPPHYFFIGNDSADLHFDPTLLPAGWRNAVETVHLGGISLMREPLAAKLVGEAYAAKDVGKKIAFDPNYRSMAATQDYAETFRSIATVADYIKVSDDDLLGIFPGIAPAEALGRLRLLAPDAHILLTRGESGMTLFAGSDIVEQSAFKVDVRDTVGCGDASMGGWISSLLLRPSAENAMHLQVAAAAAALAATHAGPYPPTLAEVTLLLRINGLTTW
ncbi:MAG: carbohydrate kinase [Gallionella sp.]